jgi:hypothetical protein
LFVAGSAQESVRSVATRLQPRIREHNLTLVAAGVAFYAFVALIPALVAFISIYGLVANPANVTRQVKDVASAQPKAVQDFFVYQLTSIIHANRAGVSITLVVAIALALWSASGGMAALVTGVHVAHERDQPKTFVKNRGRALLLTLGAIVFLSAVIFVIAALPPLLSKVGLGSAGRIAVGALRWPLLAVVMVVGIGLLYRFSMQDAPRGWLGVVTPRSGRRHGRLAGRLSPLRRVYGELLELQQDLRRPGIDRCSAPLALAELSAGARRSRGGRLGWFLTRTGGVATTSTHRWSRTPAPSARSVNTVRSARPKTRLLGGVTRALGGFGPCKPGELVLCARRPSWPVRSGRSR